MGFESTVEKIDTFNPKIVEFMKIFKKRREKIILPYYDLTLLLYLNIFLILKNIMTGIMKNTKHCAIFTSQSIFHRVILHDIYYKQLVLLNYIYKYKYLFTFTKY
jgi:hypothetical protein